jgi:MYXO-CTERM domain-containing protein
VLAGAALVATAILVLQEGPYQMPVGLLAAVLLLAYLARRRR